MLWTKEAELAIKRARIDKLIMKGTNDRFLIILNDLIDLTSKDLTKMERIQYETMVTIHVHQRYCIDLFNYSYFNLFSGIFSMRYSN